MSCSRAKYMLCMLCRSVCSNWRARWQAGKVKLLRFIAQTVLQTTLNVEQEALVIDVMQLCKTRALHAVQERLQQLEGQMVVKEAELKRLKAELEAIDSDRARSEEERKKMRATFEEKVDQAKKQLTQLQKQLREGEVAKVRGCWRITTWNVICCLAYQQEGTANALFCVVSKTEMYNQ